MKIQSLSQTRTHVERLMEYLEENDTATLSTLMHDMAIDPCATAEAIRYAVHQGVVAREKRPGSASGERFMYRLTGAELPPIASASTCSFDALLNAWGMSCNAPHPVAQLNRRIITVA